VLGILLSLRLLVGDVELALVVVRLLLPR